MRARLARTPRIFVGYLRVSTQKQKRSGLGLKAQKRAIKERAKRDGITIIEWVPEAQSAKDTVRDGWQLCLEMVRTGQAQGIIAAKMDRATRDTVDWELLQRESRAGGWTLILLDLHADLETAAGRQQARQQASYAQYERELIGERTRDALAVKRKQGVRLGRPRTIPKEILVWVLTTYHALGSYEAVAKLLNLHAVPTAQGAAVWHRYTVSKMVASQDAQGVLKKILKQDKKQRKQAERGTLQQDPDGRITV